MKLKSQGHNLLSHILVNPLGLIFRHTWTEQRCLRKASYSLKAALLSWGASVPLDSMTDGMRAPQAWPSPSPPFLFWCTKGYVAAWVWTRAPQRGQSGQETGCFPPSFVWWSWCKAGKQILNQMESLPFPGIEQLQKPISSYACWKVRKKSVYCGRVWTQMSFCSVKILQWSVSWMTFSVLTFLKHIFN